jgi:hypothetical protein
MQVVVENLSIKGVCIKDVKKKQEKHMRMCDAL